MTAPYLLTPPPKFILPFAEGGDCAVNFIYKPLLVDANGAPILDTNGNQQYPVTSYPVGATVTLTIDTTPPVVTQATITDSVASIVIPQAVADTVPRGAKWHLVLTYSNGTKLVMCNGTTARSDGK
jgi:hypothetical protein